MNALMRTTVAFTQAEGSKASNVIPPKASLVSNIRLNPEDTVESAKAYLEKTINDGDIVTIRGKGKFIINSLTDKSRKNRYIIKYKKYV